ncbi:DNA/RNA non-specific endonuclease [Sphingomonas sp. TZW2008]|uniref:DNA/RNA non-specific endonuclease n=1 Tax=Sphingomonas sp. TZW2008 TaxID=1917973 RepID=UPI0015C514BC|nr:DNA/RNA non-specific endonuclease [Sphingomonas sp. TZW2008]
MRHTLRGVLRLAAFLVAVPALADNANLHTFHCLHGCPVGAPANDGIVVREIYTLASNPLTKLADWVAYRVTPDTVGPSQQRNWAVDPALAPDETLEEDDYNGASAALHVDRGHQAPLAAFSGTPFWNETNVLSNITPQAAALNQGAWQRLEARENTLAVKGKLAVYVVTGPLFERLMAPLPAGPALHRVPSGYWKVVATADGRLTAFLFDQQTQRGADYCAMRAPLEEVVLRARLVLFPGPGAPTTWRPLDGELGCKQAASVRPEGARIETR